MNIRQPNKRRFRSTINNNLSNTPIQYTNKTSFKNVYKGTGYLRSSELSPDMIHSKGWSSGGGLDGTGYRRSSKLSRGLGSGGGLDSGGGLEGNSLFEISTYNPNDDDDVKSKDDDVKHDDDSNHDDSDSDSKAKVAKVTREAAKLAASKSAKLAASKLKEDIEVKEARLAKDERD